jgi:hypothetical protein
MSREVCGICWSPYIKGKCDCDPELQPKPLELMNECEKLSYCAGWRHALQRVREQPERTLTDEVIADLWHQNGGFHHHFARAIERWLKDGA